jgi:hypothetical protein
VGLGAGLGLGQTLAQSLGQTVPAGAGSSPADKLAQLKTLHAQALITDEEYAARKKLILDTL